MEHAAMQANRAAVIPSGIMYISDLHMGCLQL
jgi:hypothetical protein